MQTGENEQALRKIIDFTRLLSIALLILHFYVFCHVLFAGNGLTSAGIDRILKNLVSIKWVGDIVWSKSLVMLLLFISLVGAKGKKDEKINLRQALVMIVTGNLLYFFATLIFYI